MIYMRSYHFQYTEIVTLRPGDLLTDLTHNTDDVRQFRVICLISVAYICNHIVCDLAKQLRQYLYSLTLTVLV
jgi:hypothetical protein